MKYRIITALIIILIAAGVVMGTTTTWRHSGFTLWGYDIDFNGLNVTNASYITGDHIGGVTYADQYASLQDAISATDAYGTIYLTKSITTSTTIEIQKPLTLKGSRRDISITPSSGVTVKAINISLTGPYIGSFVDLEGFTLDLSNVPNIDGIELNDVNNGVIKDLRIIYGKKQLNITNSDSSSYSDIFLLDSNESAIYMGDNSGENSFTNIFIGTYAASTTMENGFLIERTTSTDMGGVYINNMRIVRNAGAGSLIHGINMTSSSGTVTGVMAFLNQVIVDGILDGSPCTFTNVGNVQMVNSWCMLSTNSYPALHLNGGNDKIQSFRITGSSFGSALAGIQMNGSVDILFVDNVHMTGSNPAVLVDTAGTKTNILFTPNNYYDYAGEISNDQKNVSKWGGERIYSAGIQINTNSEAGGAQTLTIHDGVTNLDMFIRRTNEGLQILNNSFGSIVNIDDNGYITAGRQTLFGNSATAPTANGFGDSYSNSTSLEPFCKATAAGTTSWQNSTGNTVVC